VPPTICQNRKLQPRKETTYGIAALKALEKEPSRRYQSVEELAADVRRHLDGEPILARPPSGFYVLRRRLYKHRLWVGLGTVAVVLGLVGILAGTWWSAHALEQQRNRKAVEGRWLVLSAQRCLETGDLHQALGQAREAVVAHPELPEAFLVWVHVRFRQARVLGNDRLAGIAIGDLRGECARQPAQPAFRALLAEVCAVTGHPEAAALQARADREMPETADEWYLASFATLDINKAMECTEQAVNHERSNVLAWQRLAYVSVQAKDYERALKAAQEMIVLGGEPYGWTLFAGHVLVRQGRYRQAVAQYARAASLADDDRAPCRWRALAHLCLKEYAEAITEYSRAMESHQDHATWERFQRATPLWILGETARAAADYREAVRLRGLPSYADARLCLVLRNQASTLRRDGDPAEAERVLQQARDVLETARLAVPPESWLEKILACLAGDLTPDALVQAADPRNPEHLCEAYYYAGEVCLLGADTERAQTWFQKCVDTKLLFDREELAPDPMNEYHLAVWRLDSLGTAGHAASRP